MIIRHILVLLLAASFTAWGGTYTLDQLLAEAFHNSKMLLSVENEMHKSESQVNQAIGSAFPVITASANLTHTFDQHNGNSGPDQTSLMRALQVNDSAIAAAEFPNDPVDQAFVTKYGPAIGAATIQQLRQLVGEPVRQLA